MKAADVKAADVKAGDVTGDVGKGLKAANYSLNLCFANSYVSQIPLSSKLF